MRRTAVFLAFATAAALTAKGAVASKKANRLEGRYGANYTAVWTLLNQLKPITDADNAAFLGALSQLPHQTTFNATIDTAAGSLSHDDRVAINGAINALNILQGNAQDHNFEADH